MLKTHLSLKSLRGLAVFTVAALATNLAFAQAPGTPAPPSESAPAASATSTPTKPIVTNWKLHKLDGNVNLTVNPDGTWIFSGGFKEHKKELDWDITVALKARTGAVYLFHYEGDASNGVEFSKQGQSPILADDFASFANYKWSGTYSFHLTAAGRRARYEAEQRKLEQIRKEEAEARKRRDEKIVAEKKAEERAEAKAEMQWEENYARSHQGGGGGGGSSIGSDISSAVNTVGSVVSSVGSVVGDIASFF